MKKILSVVIAAILCLSAACFAEQIEFAADESYAQVDLAGYASTRIPADWTILDVEYADDTSKLLGTFASEAGTEMMLATLTTVEEASSCEAVCDEAAAAGIACKRVECGGNTFAVIETEASSEQVVAMAICFPDANTMLTFTLTYDAEAAEAMEYALVQMMGNLTLC